MAVVLLSHKYLSLIPGTERSGFASQAGSQSSLSWRESLWWFVLVARSASTESLACGLHRHRNLSALESLVTCLSGLLPREAWRLSVKSSGGGVVLGKPFMGIQFVWLNSGLIMYTARGFIPTPEEETRRQKAYSS